ncbi:MAG: GSCFA domain-containing protein [Prevotella sp.]|nr:GSCFA domain-containing protein [Prevotella sp.]
MEFRTIVDIPDPGFRIGPCEEILFVGSCFADAIGRRFQEEKFRAVVNPYGVMYNPASILHTIERLPQGRPGYAFLTLGTNHVYRLKETGEIVDNCQKRPQSLFVEEELSVDECAGYLSKCAERLRQMNPEVHIVLTVSPIRYRKYGYHGSQLSKATLLLAVEKVTKVPDPFVSYFPAYEIVNDELRDYRFYQEDMLHPSSQAVEYIWQRLSECYLSDEAHAFIEAWQPLKAALNHRPFKPDSEEYKAFMDKTMLKVVELQKKYPTFAL